MRPHLDFARLEFDDEHIAGVDLVVVGGFRCAGVPDAAAGAFIRCGVAVAESDIVDLFGLDAFFQTGERDERRIVSVR